MTDQTPPGWVGMANRIDRLRTALERIAEPQSVYGPEDARRFAEIALAALDREESEDD